MNYKVYFTQSAEQDLEALYSYVCENDTEVKAKKLLDKLEDACERLGNFPERGGYPKELLSVGIREYREIFFKPYRIIYRVFNNAVYIYLLTDGRRDMQTLLQKRLLETALP